MEVCELITLTLTRIANLLEEADSEVSSNTKSSRITESISNGPKHEAFSNLAGQYRQIHLEIYRIASLINLNGRRISNSLRNVSGKDTYCEVANSFRRRTSKIEYTNYASEGNRRAQLEMAGKRL